MKRLYYTCPIKAAYMANYFGVELKTKNIHGFHEVDSERMLRDQDQPPFYIAEESLSIFKPRDWDLQNDQTGEIIIRDDKHFFSPEVEE